MTFPTQHSNIPWLRDRTIFYTRHGSHAYGTNIATSDEDFRGIAIPPAEYFHGFTKKFSQAATKSNKDDSQENDSPKETDSFGAAGDPDVVIFGLQKFFDLAAKSNPNALEIIFTEPRHHMFVTPIGQKLLDNRQLFLSKKAKHTFSGYARSQMRRIDLHRRYLKDPPKAPPTRADFNLPERTVIPADQLAAAFSAVQKVMDRWEWKDLNDLDPAFRIELMNNFQDRLLELTQWSWRDEKDKIWVCAAKSIGLDTNFIHLLDLERRYNAKKSEWTKYQQWVKNRNPARAEMEAKYGFDGKHGLHLARLYTSVIDLFRTGELKVWRPDHEWLLSIRNGAWTCEQLIEWTEQQDKVLEDLFAKCTTLPDKPDYAKLEQLHIEMVEESFR